MNFFIRLHRQVFTVIVAAYLCTAATVSHAQPTGKNAAAFDLMKQYQRGANLGNFLEVPPDGDWGDNSATADDYRNIAKEGFDHVRIPMGWHHYTDSAPAFAIKESFFKRVEQQLDLAEKHKLAAIINIHHFEEFTSNPKTERERLMNIWEQVATRFKNRPLSVAFEILNEPKDVADAAVMNDVFAEVVKRIRKIDDKRLLIVGPEKWNGIEGLPSLKVPDDDRVAVTVHCYEPFLFTHQGATWTEGKGSVTGVEYPQPGSKKIPVPGDAPDWVQDNVKQYNRNVDSQTAGEPAFKPLLRQAAEWGQKNNRPIYVGEFGAFTTATPEDRAAFYRDYRIASEEQGLGWCIWDWKAGFRYWDREKNAPAPGMREALFGKGGN